MLVSTPMRPRLMPTNGPRLEGSPGMSTVTLGWIPEAAGAAVAGAAVAGAAVAGAAVAGAAVTGAAVAGAAVGLGPQAASMATAMMTDTTNNSFFIIFLLLICFIKRFSHSIQGTRGGRFGYFFR